MSDLGDDQGVDDQADDERPTDPSRLTPEEAAAILGGGSPRADGGAEETVSDVSASEDEGAVGPDSADAPTAEVAATEAELPEIIDAEDLIVETPRRQSPYDRPGSWYVVHTQSGYENKVKSNVESRINSMNTGDSIFEVVIPMEEVIEFKGGKKVVAHKKVYPGYLYIRCFLDDRSWDVIRNTPGITGFVGGAGRPLPLSRADVEGALAQPDEVGGPATVRQRPRLEYELGESVRVRQGPFADFSGQIAEINEDQLKVKVLVNIFGRETPVELEFSEIAKL
ncbi:MAG: transcription termination/antitermination protein NusG [Acidimicrobiales bacterium]